MGVPVPLAGPGAGLQLQKVDADLLQPRRHRQPVSDLVLTRRVERLWIARAGRHGRAFDIDLLHFRLAFELALRANLTISSSMASPASTSCSGVTRCAA